MRYLVRLDSPSTTSTRSPEDMLDCENIFNWPLWEEFYQGLMDSFLDGSKALWKGWYSRRNCIRQHINFPAVLWAWLKTKDVRFTQWPGVASFMWPTFVWLGKKLSLLKSGFQVYHQFVCEEGLQDFCVGPILIANYILISLQFKKNRFKWNLP